MKSYRKLLLLTPAILLCATGHAQTSGYLHTSGSQILDSANKPFRIAGVNWYGFETTDEVAHGLWVRDYRTILNAIQSNGYNTIRIPISNQTVESPIVPSNVSFYGSAGPINTDLKGLNSLQILDKIVTAAGTLGLRVILDNHRSEAGSGTEANGLWYTSAYPETNWINDWITLTQRYRNNPTVIGMDLRNEPHNATSGGACWGCGTTTNDWRLAAERAGNAVLAANSSLLIFVEGTDCVNGDCDWWGGNLEGAAAYPVTLNVAGRLVYSAHDYGPNLSGQAWFNASTTPASLNAVWTKYWAYLSLNNSAPVWVGEFGTTDNNSDIQNTAAGSQGQWFQTLVSFLRSNPAINWTYWALNGEDTYGLLDNNYDPTPASALKQQLLAGIQAAGTGGGGTTCTAIAAAPSGLSATAASQSQINLTWPAVTPPANCAVTYNVYSQGSKIATGVIGTTYSATGLSASTTYSFTVTAADAAGESAHSAAASATTLAPSCVSVPPVPQSLTASAISSSRINLSWSAVTNPAGCTASYNLYSGTTASFTPSASNRIATNATATSFQATGLTASTTYYFIVRSSDAAGESANSNEAAAATQAAGGTSSCHVTYSVASQWPGGFNGGISIQNTGTSPINSWSLTWTWPSSQQIQQAWDGTATQTGAAVTFVNASWNGTIAPGASATGIGFTGSYTGTNPSPAVFFVNGSQCR